VFFTSDGKNGEEKRLNQVTLDCSFLKMILIVCYCIETILIILIMFLLIS